MIIQRSSSDLQKTFTLRSSSDLFFCLINIVVQKIIHFYRIYPPSPQQTRLYHIARHSLFTEYAKQNLFVGILKNMAIYSKVQRVKLSGINSLEILYKIINLISYFTKVLAIMGARYLKFIFYDNF